MGIEQYVEEIRKVKLLTSAEERTCWIRYKQEGDIGGRQLLIESYQPLVFKTAMQYCRCQSLLLDCLQEGMVGLIEAVETYDYTRGAAFSLFAVYRIRGRILNYLAKEGGDPCVSLDEPQGMDNHSLADGLIDRSAAVAQQVEQLYALDQVKAAINRLPLNEQLVLQGVYLDDYEPKQLADTLNISISHIYKLQKQGVRRVRGMLSRFMQQWK